MLRRVGDAGELTNGLYESPGNAGPRTRAMYEYQDKCVVLRCIPNLLPGSPVEAVAVEWSTDYPLLGSDGRRELVSVKHRDPGQHDGGPLLHSACAICRAVDAFSSGRSRVPGATDVAACGIHVDDLDGRPFRSTPMRTSTRTARLRHAPQPCRAATRTSDRPHADRHQGRLAAASSDGRPIVVEASLVAPVGGGLDRPGLAVAVTRWRG